MGHQNQITLHLLIVQQSHIFIMAGSVVDLHADNLIKLGRARSPDDSRQSLHNYNADDVRFVDRPMPMRRGRNQTVRNQYVCQMDPSIKLRGDMRPTRGDHLDLD